MVGGQEDEFCELGDRCHFAHGEDELRKLDTGKHRRRMEREAKGLGGADFVQFLAALAVLPRSICKNRMNSTVFLPNRPRQNS